MSPWEAMVMALMARTDKGTNIDGHRWVPKRGSREVRPVPQVLLMKRPRGR